MFDQLTTEEVMEMANRVGRRTARESGGDLLEAEDVAAEILVNMAELAGSLRDKGAGYVHTAMVKIADRYAAKARYDRMARFSSYLYTPKEVRALLTEAFFDPAAWDVPTRKDDRMSTVISDGTIGVSLMDLKTAFAGLSESQRELLLNRFHPDADGDAPSAMSVTRAIETLTRRMNTAANNPHNDHNGPGSPARVRLRSDAAQHGTRLEESGGNGRDSVEELQHLLRKVTNDPPGTHFNWDKNRAA